MKNYWLVKSEPDAYSWSDLVKEKKTSWTGVRNFTARNNLRGMRVGDEVLFYHSVTGKAVVGAPRFLIPPPRKAIGARSILRQSNRCATP